jgi:alkyl sulfatase BDS1-like metallo-beta-lactamase superfamily hydrolase
MDWTRAPETPFLGKISAELAMGSPPGTFLKLLETRIDPQKSAHIDKILAVHFTDLDQAFGLHVRNGVAEYIDHHPEKSDYTLALSRKTWLRFIFSEMNGNQAFDENAIGIKKGTADELKNFFGVFDAPV